MKKCRPGAVRKSWPWARIGHEGFKRAMRPDDVTKRVRAARRAEGNEGPGVAPPALMHVLRKGETRGRVAAEK